MKRNVLAGVLAGTVVTLLGGLGLASMQPTQWNTHHPVASPEEAFQTAWRGLSREDRENVCLGVTLFGVDAVADIMAPELEGTPVDPQQMAELVAKECDK